MQYAPDGIIKQRDCVEHTYTQIESKIKSVKTEKESGGYGHGKGRKQTHSHHLLFRMHAHKVSRRILVKCSCELQQISVQLISKCVCARYALSYLTFWLLKQDLNIPNWFRFKFS